MKQMRADSRSHIVFLLVTASAVAACGDDNAAHGESAEGIGFATEAGDDGGMASGAAGGDAVEDDGEAPKFDVLSGGDGGSNIGDCSGAGTGQSPAFSIIWIANSTAGTVSKVDTETAVELARYATGPGPKNPDPSRTSVNLFGDVAIANRSGSVVKIAANIDDCVDSNQDGEITTSQGANDVLPWGMDECVLWFHDVGFSVNGNGNNNQGGPRAIAWDGGQAGPDGCPHDPMLWVGWRNRPHQAVKIRRLDGGSGELLGEVDVPDWDQYWGHGTYGGATDKQRAFWGLGTRGTLVRVDAETLAVTRWDNPTPNRIVYGIALDQLGDPWLAGWDGALWRFDVGAQAWGDHGKVGSPSRLRGLAIDHDGHAWIAGNQPCGLIRYDTVAGETVAAQIELPGCSEPVGVSIDAGGFVWVVDRGADMAFKIDPDTQSVVATVTGLVNPYTYSDMTGAGLDLVVNPPIG